MNRASLLITLLMGILSVLLWAVVNRPDIEPPWPAKIAGFSFSPMRGEQSPVRREYPEIDKIDEDLALLAGDVYAVRTYTVEGTMSEVPQLAAAHGLNVALGAWISKDAARNDAEIERLIDVYRENHRQVVRVIVGNEAILREEQTAEQMISHIKRVRRSVWAPVSTAEPWHIWLEHPELVEQVDFIAVHMLPYWEGIAVDQAVDHVLYRYNELKTAYPDKPVVISEVGWPSNGRTRLDAVASHANQAKFLRRFIAAAEREGITYYVMEAFDQPWKRQIEGDAGSHWGVYDADREPKFEFTSGVVPVPNWTSLAAISIGASVLILALMFRDSAGLSSGGRGFLAMVAYAITTFVVWLLYDFTQQYMTPAMLAVGIALFIAALGVIVVLLAEAHEWAEALWRREWRRAALPEPAPDHALPKVSVHVPAYNEPPDMMIQTLDALAALDYPDYEVLVIDNNTKDPAVWQPVQAHCEKLGARFRFFHVDPLTGFKAGALNFALRNTDPAAEVVAVIDSDYVVERNWLRDLVPAFGDANMAIVQAPQDYRDGDENLFKAMCQAEYRGFFRIGMQTRNERNAIIQHGTMTMVRRRVLEEVGGWAEWCITEDAELGLRIFERGYSATYIAHSYGKGLMPDTFLDFKKQRFRWAYGAVLIMRQHLAQLMGLEKTKLTTGQRYHFLAGWLPWLADGFNLVFNLAALAWSAAMVLAPEYVAPPHVVFAVLPLSLFAFKIAKMFFLYKLRVRASLRQSLAAGLAGLALSHVIARAMLTGFVTRGVGFFRTPKRAKANGLMRALLDAREELLFLAGTLLAAYAVTLRIDGALLDVRIWSLMLVVQSVPYAAAVLLSMISAAPRLPGGLVGAMRRLTHHHA
ncbi:MAG: glycosyltransferase [Chromatiaceae bacterium]|nr:glycosyltransferase [Gammaproteobacteria bacterium]MCP5303808.1 glycosyltransferase [Chromatiaceae bacterium]MCP5313535.1 glycosyltransferase [Chromatiaceae bacterium]